MRSKPTVASSLVLAAGLALAACNDSGQRRDATPVSTTSIDGSVRQDHWNGYVTDIPPGRDRLVIELHHLSQDADLYVQGPRGREYCESFQPGRRTDRCTFNYPSAGYWSIEVAGWDRGRTHYTLSVTVKPYRSSVPLWLEEQGLVGLALSEPLAARTATMDQARALLGLLADTVDLSQTNGGDTIALTGPDLREGHVQISRRNGPLGQTLDLKLSVDSAGLQGRMHLRSVADHPVTLDHDGRPIAGRLHMRIGNEEATVRLGMDTGTGADIQLEVNPGPLIHEVDWESLPRGHWIPAR